MGLNFRKFARFRFGDAASEKRNDGDETSPKLYDVAAADDGFAPTLIAVARPKTPNDATQNSDDRAHASPIDESCRPTVCEKHMPRPVFELKFVTGRKDDAIVRLDDDEIVIGRDDSCGLRLSSIECPSVSARHARLIRRGTGYFIEDLGSRNGTLVNHSAVSGSVALYPGDLVELGRKIGGQGRGMAAFIVNRAVDRTEDGHAHRVAIDRDAATILPAHGIPSNVAPRSNAGVEPAAPTGTNDVRLAMMDLGRSAFTTRTKFIPACPARDALADVMDEAKSLYDAVGAANLRIADIEKTVTDLESLTDEVLASSNQDCAEQRAQRDSIRDAVASAERDARTVIATAKNRVVKTIESVLFGLRNGALSLDDASHTFDSAATAWRAATETCLADANAVKSAIERAVSEKRRLEIAETRLAEAERERARCAAEHDRKIGAQRAVLADMRDEVEHARTARCAAEDRAATLFAEIGEAILADPCVELAELPEFHRARAAIVRSAVRSVGGGSERRRASASASDDAEAGDERCTFVENRPRSPRRAFSDLSSAKAE